MQIKIVKLLQGPLNWAKEVGSGRDGEVEILTGSTSSLLAAHLMGEERHSPHLEYLPSCGLQRTIGLFL